MFQCLGNSESLPLLSLQVYRTAQSESKRQVTTTTASGEPALQQLPAIPHSIGNSESPVSAPSLTGPGMLAFCSNSTTLCLAVPATLRSPVLVQSPVLTISACLEHLIKVYIDTRTSDLPKALSLLLMLWSFSIANQLKACPVLLVKPKLPLNLPTASAKQYQSGRIETQ